MVFPDSIPVRALPLIQGVSTHKNLLKIEMLNSIGRFMRNSPPLFLVFLMLTATLAGCIVGDETSESVDETSESVDETSESVDITPYTNQTIDMVKDFTRKYQQFSQLSHSRWQHPLFS